MSDQYAPLLCRHFAEDMRIRGLRPKTSAMYLRAMRDFSISHLQGTQPDHQPPVGVINAAERFKGKITRPNEYRLSADCFAIARWARRICFTNWMGDIVVACLNLR